MSRGETLLLVETDPDDEALALRALGKIDTACEIRIERNGPDALDYLLGTGTHHAREGRDTPRLALLDLKLPKLDGVEVLCRMRADVRTRNVPVVVLTSSLEAKDIAACYDAGANGYIRKPLRFDEFYAAMACVGRYWLKLNVPPPSEETE